MRFSNMILGLCSVGMISAAALAGCGGDSGNTGGSGGGASSSSSSSGNMSSSSSGGSTCTAACCPTAACKAADTECIGLVDNAGQTKFGLRMAELDITAPPALASGLVASVVAGAVAANAPECNLTGTATFNWLLQFDTTAGTLKTGGAKPVTDATAGYSFVDEMVSQGGTMLHIQPITFMAKPDATGAFDVTAGQDLLVPIYLDSAAMSVVILPLKSARLTMGKLSASQNCIGNFNATGLDPANSCLPDAQNPAFISGASLDGLITLEDADTVDVSSLSQSLCVVLSGNPSMYGGTKGADGITRCKRDANMAIVYQGDTCSMAGGTCKDAVALGAKFAASSAKINN